MAAVEQAPKGNPMQVVTPTPDPASKISAKRRPARIDRHGLELIFLRLGAETTQVCLRGVLLQQSMIDVPIEFHGLVPLPLVVTHPQS